MGNVSSLAFAKHKRKFTTTTYLEDVPVYEFVTALNNNGRFFKTLHCTHAEGHVVLKVFAKRGSLTELSPFEVIVKEPFYRISPETAPNLLAFSAFAETDKAGFMARPYVYKDLYDRLSTRPFLAHVEKLWIAFQLLAALEQMADVGLAHGDIKTENVLVTSWGWLFLSDFAQAIKPTLIPQDNPVDFSFFFDSSGRRACFVAPERFYDSATGLPDDVTGPVTQAMDVFSAGCVIAELFLEDTPLFYLADLLRYREGKFDPALRLAALGNRPLEELILSMVALDPLARPTPSVLLASPLFPAYFASDLHPLLATMPAANPDDRLAALAHAFPSLLQTIADLPAPPRLPPSRLAAYSGSPASSPNASLHSPSSTDQSGSPASVPSLRSKELPQHLAKDTTTAFRELKQFISRLEGSAADTPALATSSSRASATASTPAIPAPRPPTYPAPIPAAVTYLAHKQAVPDDGALIVLALVCSSLAAARYPVSRVAGLDMLAQGALFIRDAFMLERTLPYTLSLIGDRSPAVRAAVLEGLALQLRTVRSLPRAEVNVFVEHILPALEGLEDDPDVLVRTALASSLSDIAHAALLFLELGQVYRISPPTPSPATTPLSTPRSLLASALLDAPPAAAAPIFDAQLDDLSTAIKSLAMVLLTDAQPVVRRALLPHLPQLATFFNRSGSSAFLLSHMITYLNDRDWHLRAEFFEHVVAVVAATRVGTAGVEQFLLPLLHIGLDDPEEAVVHRACACVTALTRLRLISHPQLAALAHRIAPLLGHPNPWIGYAAVAVLVAVGDQFDSVDVHCVLLPLARPYVLRPLAELSVDALLESLHPPLPRETYTTALAALADNTADFCHLAHALDADHAGAAATQLGGHTMPAHASAVVGPVLLPRLDPWWVRESLAASARELAGDEAAGAASLTAAALEPIDELSLSLHDAMAAIFDASPLPREHLPLLWAMLPTWSSLHSKSGPSHVSLAAFAPVRSISVPMASVREASSTKLETLLEVMGSQGGAPLSWLTSALSSAAAVAAGGSGAGSGPTGYKLDDLELGSISELPSETGFKGWSPSGVMVAHLAEHSGAVTALATADDSVFFASGSSDGSVKIWDANALDGHLADRSMATFTGSGSGVTAVSFVESSHSAVAGYADGSLAVVRIDYAPLPTPPGARRYMPPTVVRRLEGGTGGGVVSVCSAPGSASTIVFATRRGMLAGWDMRQRRLAWQMQVPAEYGLVSALSVDGSGAWMAAGGVRGVVSLWDLRFTLPVSAWALPGSEPITSLSKYPSPWQASWLVVGAGRNNCVSVWDLGSAQCTQVCSVASPSAAAAARSGSSLHGTFLYGPPSRVDTAVAAAARARMLAPGERGLEAAVDVVIAPELETDHATYALHSPSNVSYVLAGGGQRSLRLWDLATGNASYTVSDGSRLHGPSPMYTTETSADGATAFITEVHGAAGGGRASVSSAPASSSGLSRERAGTTRAGKSRAGTGDSGRARAASTSDASAGVSGGNGHDAGEAHATDGTVVRGPRPPPAHHADTILAITSVERPSKMVVSGSRDGVVKVWK
ncbi:VPS15 protein kinase [Thecamonas trahens ATCC 50062]|uniref:non-specific serine/threonine protein kinase n=1 Tax=Thecamonas trahens ATCC 50062 TaxID=461836 RepID=A0A0L0DE43_THETB|nr:VPS15 protein kinase [Thecamonas trahens ATCC 50062]KNC49578.1 VPS15 protein kinase [Thecamonas trahens ATCC 50062]|eukprot:XP_013757687.1 VPS15 protein kinase [Thecamonas trahens ATCC 50062]